MQQDKLLTTAEVAERLRIKPDTLWRWAKETPPYGPVRFQVAGSFYYWESQVEQFIMDGYKPALEAWSRT